MILPDFPPITAEVLHTILERLGLQGRTVTPLPQVGIFNAAYLVGEDLILRIPRQHPAFIAALRREAIAVPAARSWSFSMRRFP